MFFPSEPRLPSIVRRILASGAAALALGGPAWAKVPVDGFEVRATFPHDPAAYTEGLFYLDGQLFESTGLEGRSDVRRVRLADGVVLQRASIAP
jgi:glutamine cyclotransferase